MRIQSLCPIHRKWLVLHPGQAISYMTELQDISHKMRQEHKLEDALLYLKWAYEVSALLIEKQIEMYPQVAIQFTANAISLSDTLSKVHSYYESTELLTHAYQKLEMCSADMEITTFVPPYIESCLKVLQSGIRFFEQPRERPQSRCFNSVH